MALLVGNVKLSPLFFLLSSCRVDKTGTRIVGVLCGLRYYKDERNQPCAVFPDHDLEIRSEVEITSEDVAKASQILT